MNYVLTINAAVSLIMGCALVLVWRRDRAQTFTLYIGWSNLLQLLVPMTYLVKTQGSPTADMVGNYTLAVIAGAYSTLVLAGLAHLAGRPMGQRQAMQILVALSLGNSVVMALGGPRLAQAGMATVNTILGMVCTYWLWNASAPRYSSEKLVGPLLVCLGLIQFIYVIYLDAGAMMLATLGALLRILLGLVLLYAAMERGIQASRTFQERFERLTERSHQGIMICHGSGHILYANPAYLAIYGAKTLADMQLRTIAKTIPRAERKEVSRMLNQIQRGERDGASYEAQRYRMDGTPMWLRLHCFRTEWEGEPAVQVLISDETERHRANQALIHQALHDELTGLPNRAALIQNLRTRCQGSERFVLVLMNLDRFKLFNEAHGHSMGDEVLRAVGLALRATMDPACEVLRLAGDEFALLCSSREDGDTAVDLVTRVRQLLGRPMQVAGQSFFLDASLGIALYPSSARDAESLLRAANAAMHVAKRTPGTSHRLAEKAFERGSSNALEHEQALRAAIEHGEFELVYQPKVDAYSGRLSSFEALARWNRPGMRPVSPVEFIAAAERTGLIGLLGTLLLRQACQQIATWQTQYERCVPVAVNVSPLQLLDPRFPELVGQILQASGVSPHWLTLEITESSAVQNLEQTTAQIEQLRAMGVQVAMDDFGTGFSSLNMLRNLRLHTVKIDRGLIDPLPNPQSIAVVRAICQLADALHLHVVAEGVETSAQASAAREAGCAELQGYLYARPLAAEDAQGWLDRHARLHWSETMEMPTQSGKLEA